MKNVYLFILLLSSIIAIGQNMEGLVIDASTNEPIPFTTVIINQGNSGVSADIDGKFILRNNKIKSLTFSAIGYEKKKISLEDIRKDKYKVRLKTNDYQLGEVVIIPGENPAHRIINLAVENRKKNNPESNTSFFYESYNKMVFTTPTDTSKRSMLDSITIQSAIEEKTDSFKMTKVLFLMESVAERNYIPPHLSKEVVTESRISGLSIPFFSLLGTQMQSFSLYQDFITIYGLKYLSPVSKGSTSKYLFVLEDTLYSGLDTSFIISFRPRKNKFFKGLQGVLSINSNQYAVEHFNARQNDSSGFPIQVQQRYQLINGKQWFPSQLHIDILFIAEGFADIDIKGSGKSYLRKIELASKLEKKEIGNLSLEMADSISNKNEEYWEKIREVPLSQKEKRSYTYIDSIGKEYKLDQLVHLNKGLLNNHIPIGKVNLLLDKFLKFNLYEGTRLGLGMETSEKLIKSIRLGGFAGYGLGDKAWKYGSHIRWVPKSERMFETKFSYSKDLINIGSVSYFQKTKDITSTSNIQNFLNDQMDGIEKYEAEISFRAIRDFHFTLFGNTQNRRINSNYAYKDIPAMGKYQLSEIGVNVRFSFQEKFAEFLDVKLPIVTKYPIVYFKYTKGIRDLLLGDYDYNRLDLSIYKSAQIKGIGTTAFQLSAGKIDQQIPLTSLFVMRGILNEEVKVASMYSFETMYPNEFFADEYVNLFFRHNFGKLLFQSAKFKPELLLVSSLVFGNMSGRNQHQIFDFKVPHKGYYESGIQLNNFVRMKYIYNGVYIGAGLGVYYRYGDYQLPKAQDNFAFKLTTSISL